MARARAICWTCSLTEVLGPHLAGRNLYLARRLVPTSAGGRVNRQRILRDTLRQRQDTYVTTFFDLYGLPSDFPGPVASSADPLERAAAIEEALHEEVVRVTQCRPDRFVPHIQPCEFEALLFSDTSQFAREQPAWAGSVAELAVAGRRAGSPEHINDGSKTHPSARLERLSGYRKVRDGTAVARRIGLCRIRRECAHFADWVARLESLAALG
ncbi:MAG: DUF4276 family protein [Spirochaetaceae bacterium]|nr:DUF4276 family protein [Spirochaetaceae bacterium]